MLQRLAIYILPKQFCDNKSPYVSTQVLQQFKKVSQHFPVFKPRVMHMQAYNMMIKKKFTTAKQMLNEAINTALMMNNTCDSLWAEYNKMCWFSPNDQLLETIICSMGTFHCLPIHTTPNYYY